MNTYKCPTEKIREGYHPRKTFTEKPELKKSIEKQGLLDPILVRKDGDNYVVIDGLTRLKAVKELGWKEVACIVQEIDEKQAAHLSYAKNTDTLRKNLNPIEVALHIKAMLEQYGYSMDELVELGCYGKNQSTIYNKLQLLTLPDEVQRHIAEGKIKPTVGYHLMRLDDKERQIKLAEEVASKSDVSTRQVKREVDSLSDSKKGESKTLVLCPKIRKEGAGGEGSPEKAIPTPNRDPEGLPLNRIVLGDCLEQLKKLPDESVDQIVTDPPYGMAFMAKDWDKAVPSVDIWKECLRVLKPGAFAFIMCTPRQDCLARMIINIEDAGFDTDSSCLFWAQAKGFPKAHNVSMAIDKKLGADRKVVGLNPHHRKPGSKELYREGATGPEYITEPATLEAKEFEGAYGGFQPRPTVETIIVAMKPRNEKTYADQAMANGKSVSWMDSCRIPYQDESGNSGHNKGRFPANLLVSDNALGEFSRYFSLDAWEEMRFPFLIVPKPSKQERDAGLDGLELQVVGDGRKKAIDNPFQQGETQRKNTHPTVKPIRLMAYLVVLGSREGDVVLDPFCGSGSTCIAAKLLNRKHIGIEIDPEYHEIAVRRLEHYVKHAKAEAAAVYSEDEGCKMAA